VQPQEFTVAPLHTNRAGMTNLRHNSPCNSPCVASPVGNSPRGGPGLSGLVHEEAHPSISYHTYHTSTVSFIRSALFPKFRSTLLWSVPYSASLNFQWKFIQSTDKFWRYSTSRHINIRTRSTETVHTSAKARLASAAIWRINVNECPLTIFPISQ